VCSQSAVVAFVNAIPAYVVLALTWTVGATVDASSRLRFDAFLRERMLSHPDVRLSGFANVLSPTAPPMTSPLPNAHHRHRSTLTSPFNSFYEAMNAPGSPFTGFPFPFPSTSDGTVYDFVFDGMSNAWKPWMSLEADDVSGHHNGAHRPAAPVFFSEVIVPNKDSVRYKYVMKALIMVRTRPGLCCVR
jgi:hypothetical protein